jgi:hypothetical protein
VNPINFPLYAVGFANVNDFRVRNLNVPEFGSEDCATTSLGIGGNTFSINLFDDGTGLDDNHNQALDPTDPTGDNVDPAFDLLEGPTDLRFTTEPVTNTIIGCPPRREASGHFVFEFCRMDLLGTEGRPVITGFSIGGQAITNPPGLCETNLSTAATASESNLFRVIDGQVATIQACLIGEGTEPTIFELFNSGHGASIGSGGEVTLATPDFDLRFEGNDAALCTATRQRDLNKGKVGFFGLSCPSNPICQAVTPVGTVTVAPNQPAVGSAAAGSQLNSSGARIATPTSGIINAIGNVTLNFFGCFFIPNETTTICQGFAGETGVPLQRPGKTVSSALALGCDSNGDGLVDVVVNLTNVTPTNINLVRGTLSAPAGSGLNCTAFPLTCCGGLANLTLTTTFTAGDNNVFGAFTRTTTCVIDLGVRAPVVISVTPSNGNCAVGQDLLISGACFILPSFGPGGVGSTNVTSVFAVEVGNPANVKQATNFTILNPNLIDAFFNFGSASAGKTFLIFVTGPNGTSQNLTTALNGCLGNQQGVQITFTCNAAGGGTPGTGGTPEIATVTSCKLDRQDTGQFFLDVTGTGIKEGATATVGGVTPKKIKVVEVQPGTTNPTKLRLVKKVCNGLPGAVIITNPGPNGGPSQPFNCTERCPTQ